MLLLLCCVFLSFRAFWNTNPPHVVILSNRAWRGCRRISSGDLNLYLFRNCFCKETSFILHSAFVKRTLGLSPVSAFYAIILIMSVRKNDMWEQQSMSFQMIHMEIACRVMERLGLTEGREAFLLGSVAPDAVHMRPDYTVESKIHSHLFEGCGPWGDVRDNERWLRNMDRFRNIYEKDEKDVSRRMLAAGIFVHCMTDYWNDVTIWNGTRREYVPPMDPTQFKEAFYAEASAIDKWLYQHSSHTEEIRSLLAAAKEEGLADYFTAEDIAKMKHHLLHVQYDVPAVDISAFRYYTREKLEHFLVDVTEDVCRRLA